MAFNVQGSINGATNDLKSGNKRYGEEANGSDRAAVNRRRLKAINPYDYCLSIPKDEIIILFVMAAFEQKAPCKVWQSSCSGYDPAAVNRRRNAMNPYDCCQVNSVGNGR